MKAQYDKKIAQYDKIYDTKSVWYDKTSQYDKRKEFKYSKFKILSLNVQG